MHHAVVGVGVQPAPARRGPGSMTSPSGSCSTRAPTAVSTSSRACSRSVSCPRRWPIPVSRDGPSASAHSAARTGVSSPTSPRSATSGAIAAAAGDLQPVGRAGDLGAHGGEQPVELGAGLGGDLRPVADGHPPAGDQRGGEERRGVGEVGLDHAVAARRSARGTTRQPRSVAVDVDAVLGAACVTVISTCGIDGTPPASVRSRPSSNRAAASSSPETICEDSLASTVDRAAADRARCRAR